MKKIILTIAVLFNLVPFAAAYAIEDAVFVLDRDLCKYIIAYSSQKDGTAEYKPGVDVKGKPVVEANVSNPVVEVPESISFPLTVEMAEYAKIPIPEGVKTGEATLGYVEIREDGAILFNGQPLEGEAETTLKSLCTNEEFKKTGKLEEKVNK